MIKLIGILVCVLLASTQVVWGQTFKQIAKTSAAVERAWEKGQTEKAVKKSEGLYGQRESFFYSTTHDRLVRLIQQDENRYWWDYLEALWGKVDPNQQEALEPLYLWGRAVAAQDQEEYALIREDLLRLQKENFHEYGKLERYAQLTLQELVKNNAASEDFKKQVVANNIARLEAYPYLVEIPEDHLEYRTRASNRFLLAYAYDYLFSYIEEKEEYLRNAAEFSLDEFDLLNSYSAYHDGLLLTGFNGVPVGFRSKYQAYLVENSDDTAPIELLAEFVFMQPTDANLKALKERFANQHGEEASFETFWREFITSKATDLPSVSIPFESEVLDLATPKDHWTYVYVWGTWCAPCVKDLPNFQPFYADNLLNSTSNLKIYTLSYMSRNLGGFMKKNGYTFPVSEISNELKETLGISKYPTKMLITPEGKFIELPMDLDWQTSLRNYVLL
ncbi:TlpA family protein disulfide reductase [Mongoliitalea daihaiensis]|uniref:TlpA family protein disulfide reductase n=1 Tax=Mongoliitalea daihaiensis TaxID=2782006 RepID=UPI001F40CE1B|nr:TlpA disulfide reductase family protein [Mongoliitalea daihaiensis]UJP65283.1 TlpA family protein disulfide reductase [Mongoliitalea daihaiensis]